MAEIILELRNVWKIYPPSTEVLKGVNLKVYKGDFIGIFGPSGSGKSTLLYLSAGLETPTKGEIYLFNQRIDHLPTNKRDKIRKGKLAYIFQYHYLLEDFSVWENIKIFAELVGSNSSKKSIEERIEEILKFLGIYHRKDFKPIYLSGGEQQRVAIARALIINPLLILADEPTGNLDSKREEEIFQYFKKLNEKGITFLVVSHNEKLKKFFNRIFYLQDGILKEI